MTTRRSILALLLLLGACSRNRNNLTEALPVEVQREWRLHDTQDQPLESAPAELRSLGLKAWMIAHYRTSETITVKLYDLGSNPVAFEAFQKWRGQEGLAMNRAHYLVVVSSDDVPKNEQSGFLQDLLANIKL